MFKMKNETYDILKYIVTIALPATEALWLTLGNIWNFPYVVEIGATIAAITVFLGALLGISTQNYKQEQKVLDGKEQGENQMLMMENLLEEDEQQLIKGE